MGAVQDDMRWHAVVVVPERWWTEIPCGAYSVTSDGVITDDAPCSPLCWWCVLGRPSSGKPLQPRYRRTVARQGFRMRSIERDVFATATGYSPGVPRRRPRCARPGVAGPFHNLELGQLGGARLGVELGFRLPLPSVLGVDGFELGVHEGSAWSGGGSGVILVVFVLPLARQGAKRSGHRIRRCPGGPLSYARRAR